MDALILVDIQNDFLPGGALGVPGGHEIIPVVNRLQTRFGVVTATQDWHPPGHGSFASAHPGREVYEMGELGGLPQVLWPDHCVQGTRGAELAPGLDTRRIAHVFKKGVDPGIDSYSTFFDNAHRRSTGLGDWLSARGVTDVYLAGLATDYCVLYSARDAVHLGFRTHVVADACRGIDVSPGDVERAFDEMRRLGVHIVGSDTVLARPPPPEARAPH
jgi:nicotinamidase/pyrazinamidase